MLRENDGRGATRAGEVAGFQPGGQTVFRKFRKNDTTTITAMILVVFIQSSSNAICPAEQMVFELRAKNNREGRGMSEEFYRRELQALTKSCAVAGERLRALRPLLDEFRQGKRDDRDGFIIAQQMLGQFEVLRTPLDSEAVEAETLRSALLKKHPDFSRMQDLRLSNEIAAERRRDEDEKGAISSARKWVPPDVVPVQYVGSGRNLAVVYQYRVEFYRFPDGATFEVLPERKLRAKRRSGAAEQEFKLSELKPANILRFRKRLQTRVMEAESTAGHFLMLCTWADWRATSYAPMSPEEAEMTRLGGGNNWSNPLGEHADFCGVVSTDGLLKTRFDFRQTPPTDLLVPVGILRSGRAAVAVGERVVNRTSDGEFQDIGNFRELLIWESPNRSRRVRLAPPERTLPALRQRFDRGEF